MSVVQKAGKLRDIHSFLPSAGDHPVTVTVPSYAWTYSRIDGQDVECWCAGVPEGLDQIIGLFLKRDFGGISEILKRSSSHFGLILRSGGAIFAAVDKIQSFPVFFECEDSQLKIVSADGRVFRNPSYSTSFNRDTAELFRATGYCFGGDTLLNNVRRLRPGELLYQGEGAVELLRYYVYQPRFSDESNEKGQLVSQLGDVLNGIVGELLARNRDKTVLLSLSAGLDSRLLLGKLVEHGCRDLIAFSYGASGNMEATEAEKFAKSLGVKWRFLPETKSDLADFRNGNGAEYLRFSSGVHTSPVFTEYYALKQLAELGYSRKNAVVVNGQSGDFITGGHLSPVKNFSDLSQVLSKKHFSLMHKLGEYPQGNLEGEAWLRQWAEDNDFDIEDYSENDLFSLHLHFEWQERQSSYIVNQQRACDWFDLAWEMPLWSPKLMDFFAEVPIELQLKQELYKTYLQSWNFGRLFDTIRAPYDPWNKYKVAIVNTGRAIGLLFGAKIKNKFYQRAMYISDQSYIYRFFSAAFYLKYCSQIRNPATLFAFAGLVAMKRDVGVQPEGAFESAFSEMNKF
ncbi:asparagine synthase-related protein [uncultured Thalassospira sp.]|jgi:asparagine synthase (glutamine-hydrolysing)|uniref:asparagine synthase-related protein n=1 Tax=uncultured Thalassospira sp. TaxID=404382 RepID=UPI0032B14F7B|tara:strand:- start:42068 stop:43774 length:1707 start_codon:yes stop_codon:yes gene_type:complete